MIVLDASVLIAHLDPSDCHHDRADQVLLGAAADLFAASPITLGEVLVGPARAGKLGRAMDALRRLEITGVALPEDAPERLAVLRAGTGLKMPDCCVLLAAGQASAAVATFDERLGAAARSKGLDVRS